MSVADPISERTRSVSLERARGVEQALMWVQGPDEATARPSASPPAEPGYVSAEELARRQGVRPLTSAHDLAEPGMFESDEELEEFLADLYASRRAGTERPWSFWTPTSRRRASGTGYRPGSPLA